MSFKVLGCGAMGRAAAFGLLKLGPDQELTLVDAEEGRVAEVSKWLNRNFPEACVRCDTQDLSRYKGKLGSLDEVLVAALPWQQTEYLIESRCESGAKLLAIARPPTEEIERLSTRAREAGVTVVAGCGLEPGLTEIMATQSLLPLHCCVSLEIKCGGIPKIPKPPLNHKSFFGSSFPLSPRKAFKKVDGKLLQVERFSGTEKVLVDKVGICEAHHDGLMPTFAQDARLSKVANITQKTIRRSGFCQNANFLRDCGFLSEERSSAKWSVSTPLQFTKDILESQLTPGPGDEDLVALLVSANGGSQAGKSITVRSSLLAEFDRNTELSAMAQVTGFVAASVARILSHREARHDGFSFPYEFVTEERFDALCSDLARFGLKIKLEIVE